MSVDIEEQLLQECKDCGAFFYTMTCPTCDTSQQAEADLDRLVEQSSFPNLGALLQRGFDSGVLKPTGDYSWIKK